MYNTSYERFPEKKRIYGGSTWDGNCRQIGRKSQSRVSFLRVSKQSIVVYSSSVAFNDVLAPQDTAIKAEPSLYGSAQATHGEAASSSVAVWI